MTSFPEGFYKRVNGFITEAEAELLYRLAQQVPDNGKIVEIGAYQGRSTCALAIGARRGTPADEPQVYSIDSHPTYEAGGTLFGPKDNALYYENIAHYGIGDIVRTINLPSEQVILCWVNHIDLLWIDGSHEEGQVRFDWFGWSWHADIVAMHDTAGHHPAVTALVSEIIVRGEWEVIEKVDAITVLKRVKGQDK